MLQNYCVLFGCYSGHTRWLHSLNWTESGDCHHIFLGKEQWRWKNRMCLQICDLSTPDKLGLYNQDIQCRMEDSICIGFFHFGCCLLLVVWLSSGGGHCSWYFLIRWFSPTAVSTDRLYLEVSCKMSRSADKVLWQWHIITHQNFIKLDTGILPWYSAYLNAKLSVL